MVQLRLLTDIVGFDLTHIYLKLDVLDKPDPNADMLQERSVGHANGQAVLKLTMPECHVFLRALREFHGLIEVTTPVLEEAKRLAGPSADEQNSTSDPEPVQRDTGDNSLDSLVERLNARLAERPLAQSGS